MVRRTGLPVRYGILAALVVGVLPMLVVLVAALAAGAAVFVLTTLCVRLASAAGLGPRPSDPAADASVPADDGRENVRVIQRP
jgi:hypothetical protein